MYWKTRQQEIDHKLNRKKLLTNKSAFLYVNLLVCSVIHSPASMAQEDHCSDVLVGIYDKSDLSQSSHAMDSISQSMCGKKDKSGNHDGEVGYGPIKIKGSFSGKEIEEWCNNNASHSEITTEIRSKIQKVQGEVV